MLETIFASMRGRRRASSVSEIAVAIRKTKSMKTAILAEPKVLALIRLKRPARSQHAVQVSPSQSNQIQPNPTTPVGTFRRCQPTSSHHASD